VSSGSPPLKRSNAEDAIVEPAKKEVTTDESSDLTPVFSYAPETLQEILDFLCNPEGSNLIKDEIDPSQLQLLTQTIEEKVRERSSSAPGEKIIVDQNIVHGRAEMQNIIQDFYERVIEQFPPSQRSNVIDLFENENKGLISPAGKRLSRAQEVIQHDFRIEDDMLNKLQEKRLLRSEFRLGDFYYELSHDTLIKPIQEARKKREEKQAKKRRDRKITLTFLAIPFIIIVLTWALWPNIQFYVGPPEVRITYYSDKGQENFAKGEFRLAEENFNKALAAAGNLKNKGKRRLLGIYVGLGEAYMAQKKYQEAINNYDEAISIYDKLKTELEEQQKVLKMAAYYGSANANSAMGRNSEAIKKYEKAEELNPNDPNLLNLALAYLKEGKSSKALDIINRLNKNMKKNEQLRQIMKQGYSDLIKKAGGEFAPFRDGLGQIYLLESKFKEANEEFEKAIKIAKDNDLNLSQYNLDLAESCLALHQYKDAIDKYNKALNLGLNNNEDIGKAYYGLGNAYSSEKNSPEAIKAYKRAIEYGYPDGRTYIYLAEAYFKNDQKEKALENVKIFFDAMKISGSLIGITKDTKFFERVNKLQEALSQHSGNTIKEPEGSE
jgi:tetratricopeptide (TPR) repeat protein